MRERKPSTASGLEDGRGRTRTGASSFAFSNLSIFELNAINPRRMDPPKLLGTRPFVCSATIAGSSIGRRGLQRLFADQARHAASCGDLGNEVCHTGRPYCAAFAFGQRLRWREPFALVDRGQRLDLTAATGRAGQFRFALRSFG